MRWKVLEIRAGKIDSEMVKALNPWR